jgi:hypothetical protein
MNMKFYYISSLQKLEIGILTFIFCIFIGFLRPFIINADLNSKKMITLTLLFFVWLGMTTLFTNCFTYESTYKKIVNV